MSQDPIPLPVPVLSGIGGEGACGLDGRPRLRSAVFGEAPSVLVGPKVPTTFFGTLVKNLDCWYHGIHAADALLFFPDPELPSLLGGKEIFRAGLFHAVRESMSPKENPERRRRTGLENEADITSATAGRRRPTVEHGTSEISGNPEVSEVSGMSGGGTSFRGVPGVSAPADVDLTSPARSKNSFVEALALVMTALMLALTLKTYVAEAYEIKGRSMLPTFHNGQRVVVLKAFYAIERGDIIIFESTDGSKDLIKRVVGLPGETILLENGRVFIDGRPLEEDYLEGTNLDSYGLYREEVLKEDEYYVLGDNRGDSHDSRKFRGVPLRNIKGKVIVRWWPLGDLSCF